MRTVTGSVELCNRLLSRCSAAAAPLSVHARRSSNFSLVGSHKITLASLGRNKFPLDKVLPSAVTIGTTFFFFLNVCAKRLRNLRQKVKRLGAAPAPSTSGTRCYTLHFFVCSINTAVVTCLPPPFLSVSPPLLRWNLKAKSGGCWEMNFRKRFHSFHNSFNAHWSPMQCFTCSTIFVTLVG